MLTMQFSRRVVPRRVGVYFLMMGCILVLLVLLVPKGMEAAQPGRVQGVSSQRHSSGQGSCPTRSQSYTVVAGNTLSSIAARYGTTWAVLATYNHIANPNAIMPGQIICIPAGLAPMTVTPVSSSAVPIGYANPFPYGQCTWWADERYATLHNNVYVPWAINSNAWQWQARARDFGWQVLDTPGVGDIIDLQPNVQGASSLGHVGVVEQILPNGDVWASSMNWGFTPQQRASVTYAEFVPGDGVTFLRQ